MTQDITAPNGRASTPEPEAETLASDLVWGIHKIAAFIGRTPSQTYGALRAGAIPAREINNRWVASKSKLRAHLTGEAA